MTDQPTELAPPSVETGNGTQNLPSALERSEVPLYFRQFKNAAVLKKLAHSGKGPLYQLIGKTAWYETSDIIAWLAGRKRSGPARMQDDEAESAAPPPRARQIQERRGRPTKAAQWRRAQAAQGET
jgi:hypothetical protein